ncbi:hypothetical protein OEZ85_011068 [Tetradesmus obliquus]|uniref:Uncharacterized protein n=1 Tax=Tetradesmus obliquus TaxID=3088 RepID=A0ABY8TP55_TETOB|nr:hypothetical protein OEZ85_011068 [Tetradesmus obliquus]
MTPITPPNAGCSLVRTVTPSPRTAQHVTVQVTNQELFDLITNDASLSADSKALYIGSLRRLVVTGSKAASIFPANTSLLWVLTHPEQASELLCSELQRRGLYSPHNVHNYIQPLRAVMARHPYLKKLADVRERWRQAVAELSVTPLAEAAKLNLPTRRQAQGFVPYETIVAKFKQLCEDDLGCRDSLLVGLIALAEHDFYPQRVDYGQVRLYIGSDCEGAAAEAGGNYLVLLQPERHRFSGYIMLNSYKTFKTYGTKRIDLPLVYLRTLLASLQREPRSWLFTKRCGPADMPYDKANSFGSNFNSRLKKLFGRPLTVSGARHACITHMHSSRWLLQPRVAAGEEEEAMER